MSKSCSLKAQQKLFFLQLGQAASCCRADPISLTDKTLNQCLDLWQQERTELQQGNEIPGCKHCWQAEHSGQQSYRQQMQDYNYNYVEIFVSNLCNQTCSYCSPKFSSAWDDNIKQHGQFVNVSKSSQKNLSTIPVAPDSSDWIDQLQNYLSQGPVSVKLLGGEPLMQKNSLQKLLELNTDQIQTLSINTNLNPPSNKFLQWVLGNFPRDKLHFDISLDTVPEHNAVPRAGFDAVKFEENLAFLKQHNVPFVFLSVISVLNIFSVADYESWLEQQGFQAKFFRLNNPDCLDASYLPAEFKTQISLNKLPAVAKESLGHAPLQVDLKRFEQYNYLKQYFYRTNTVITDTRFAEYWQWLKDHYESSSSIGSSS